MTSPKPYPTNPAASNAAPAASPAEGSSTRMIVLLTILVVVTAVTAYDYLVAAPATDKANKALEKFVIERNERGIERTAEGEDVSKRADQFVRSEDVQKIIGCSPSLVRKFENDQGGHVVEYYFFRPWLPVPEMGKHYVSVVYWGLKNPRYMSHHVNTVPPPETAPDYREPERAATGAPAPTGGVDPGTMPGAGGMKGKSPGAEKGTDTKAESKTAEETPAVEKPAETKPAAEKAAEPPAAENSTEEKPVENPPATEKPAEVSP